MTMATPSRVRSAAWYLAAIAVVVSLQATLLRLDKADLSVPIEYVMRAPDPADRSAQISGSGDSYFMMMLFRVICETGSAKGTASLGAPLRLDLRDHPIVDSLQMALARIICALTGNYAIAINIFYLLGYPLAAVSCMFCLRRLGVWPAVAMGCGVLFAFLPYHMWRGQGHLFLGHYWPIPPVVVTSIWLATGRRFTCISASTRRRRRISARGWMSLVSVTLIACAGAYYALFSLFMLGCASLMRLWRVSSWRSAAAPAILIVALIAILGLNALPFVLYQHKVGPNPQAVVRSPSQAEFFSLKPIQLILPVEGHRLEAFRDLADRYANTSMFVSENRMSPLGAFGAIGFLILIAWLLGLRWKSYRLRTMTAMAQLNLAMLLLGMVGGISSVLAFCVSPSIRSYTRVSVFIAFLALVAYAYAFERMLGSRALHRRKTMLLSIAVPAVIVLGVLDQVPPRFIPLYEQSAASYASDRQFVQNVERPLAAGSMIFELPYVEFPEGSSPAPYELFRPYLHSRSLRWSFGAMKGRDADTLVKGIMSRAGRPDVFVSQLRETGYAGVYLDRALDADHSIESYLRKNLATPPLESADHRLLFFPLPPAASSPSSTQGPHAAAHP